MAAIARFSMPFSFWLVRAPLAVAAGVVIAQIAQIPLALLLDPIWQNANNRLKKNLRPARYACRFRPLSLIGFFKDGTK